jgi:prepilin-type N-terminal cleavage/methylation domain-containing protein
MTQRRAFTLVEVLVALVLLALAVAALGTTLTADRRLRTEALVYDAAALRLRERIEVLAARCAGADTSGWIAGAWGAERWRAVASAGAWSLSDSVLTADGRVTLAVDAAIVCRP